MKKLVLTVALVALLAAAVFGGQAIASNKPADVTLSEEMSQEILFDWGSSYRGYPLRMETLLGSDVISTTEHLIVDENYSGVRHVSISVSALGMDHIGDYVEVLVNESSGRGSYIIDIKELMGGDYHATCEFNAEHWSLAAGDTAGDPLEVFYWATITYPSNQW